MVGVTAEASGGGQEDCQTGARGERAHLRGISRGCCGRQTKFRREARRKNACCRNEDRRARDLSGGALLCRFRLQSATAPRAPKEAVLSTSDVAARGLALQRILCIVILALMVVATLYAGWIGIANYPRIRV